MAFSLLGLCSPAAGFSTWSCRNLIKSSFRHHNLSFIRKVNYQKCGAKMSTMSGVCDETIRTASPWLMLPPIYEKGDVVWPTLPHIYERGDMVYRFYSLAENKVVGLNKRSDKTIGIEKDWPDDDAKIVGSSRGWLALFHEHNCDLFLYNPISRRHIKLPPINTLPNIPESNLRMGRGCLSNIIISSSSPDEKDCRVMITYGPEDRLAFCCPGHSTEWTPLGDMSGYDSLVYSKKQKLFFCTTTHGTDHKFEAWDLGDPLSPSMTHVAFSVDEDNYPLAVRSELELDLKSKLCEDYKFLAIAEQSDQLFHVRRFVLPRMGPDGSYVDTVWYGSRKGYDDSVPYKTVGFDVHKYDPETGLLKYMDRTLDGLALFIGCNDGFALSAADFPELKPNSIYYTDTNGPPEWIDKGYGGHDVGIFNYENETFSSCYYPCGVNSIKRIVPYPKWFTPTS